MVKFKHKVDGFIFTVKEGTVQYNALRDDVNYEIVKEEKVIKQTDKKDGKKSGK